MARTTIIHDNDIVYYALYLVKSRNNYQTPYVTFQQIEQYKKQIINGLDSFKMKYQIIPGETIPADLSYKPELQSAVEKISLNVDKSKNIYWLNKEHSTEALFARVNATTPMYIRSFFEPEGYEQLLNLAPRSEQARQRSK